MVVTNQNDQNDQINSFFKKHPEFAKDFYVNRAINRKAIKNGCDVPDEFIDICGERKNFLDWRGQSHIHSEAELLADSDNNEKLKNDVRLALLDNQKRAIIKTKLEGKLMSFAEAKLVDAAVAEKLEAYDKNSNDFYHGYADVVDKKRNCYNIGKVAMDGDKSLFIPEVKCSDKLCVHCSNKETRRVIMKYVPHLMDLLKKGGYRLQTAVFTLPNYPKGQLKHAQEDILNKFKKLSKLKELIPVDERIDRTRKRLVFPDIMGSFAVVEAPLAIDKKMWNIHLNVIFLINGRLNWARLRKEWGGNMFIRQAPTDETGIIKTFKEIVKYVGQSVTAKADSKAEKSASMAPGIMDWSPELVHECYQASRNFRRTRTYGCFYKIKMPDFSANDLAIIGSFELTHDGIYSVTLIQGNNFLIPHEKNQREDGLIDFANGGGGGENNFWDTG